MNIENIKKSCCGCLACMNICPAGAISVQENEEGFQYPIIDKTKCTNCGLCAKSCPVINPKHNNNPKPDCYAAMASDELRRNSSSGGIFPVIAYHILSLGGYVAGAIWHEKNVIHIVSNNKEDIEKMQGSKYLQSNIGNCFKEIKNLLNQNKQVLFTGTPCQVAGLKSFLNKDYPNLLTVDLICHGVPSPKVFHKYLENTLPQELNFIKTNFRDKLNGWSTNSTITTHTSAASFSDRANENDFMKAFLKNLCLRECCNECQFNKLPRQADLTIGDFWAINKFNPKLNDNKGTSVILANNEKGEKLLAATTSSLKLLKKVPLKYALKGNPVLTKPFSHHINRTRFFKDINTTSLQKAVYNNLNEKYDGVILNLWFSANNYGAVLTAYCIQQYLKEFGKDYRLLNWIPPKWKKRFPNSFCETFAKKHLKLTKEFINKADIQELNACTDNFIVGSDQVFRYKYTHKDLDLFLLKFTEFSKKRIALSASFGKNTYEGDQLVTYETQKALKRFDAISTREHSGINLCKEIFNVEAEHILDPVFLVQKDTIRNLIDTNITKYNKKIVTYVLDNNKTFQSNIDKLSKNLNKEHVSIVGKNIPLEEWLNAISNCDYFVTDSFHGACMAIIFHKPFICLKNMDRGAARFESLQNSFSIYDNFVYDINLMSEPDIINSKINWQNIDEIISAEQTKAKEWLNAALNSSKTNQTMMAELDFLHNYNNSTKLEQSNAKEHFGEKIFSIKKITNVDKKYIIIRFFGIKIKIRRKK